MVTVVESLEGPVDAGAVTASDGGAVSDLVPSGVEIAWNVTRQQLADGLGYTIALKIGTVRFTGTVDDVLTIGDRSAKVCVPTNPATGQILEDQWAGLGPFTHPFGCAGLPADLIGNHISEARIECEYPSLGDEIDYDPDAAVTTGYTGPDGIPVWRVIDDGNENGFIDLNIALGNSDDVMGWLVTYVENVTGRDLELNICFGSDDNGQVLVDDEIVHNNSVCRGSSGCQDSIPYTMAPGFHAIKMAAWDRGGSWNCNLALERADDRSPIVGGDPEIVFHGPNRPVDFEPPPCSGCEGTVQDLTCERGAGGSVDISWMNPDGCEEDITILVYGEELATVSADTAEFTITAEDFPIDGSIQVANGIIAVASCSLIEADETHTEQGFVSAWLHLGPFAQQDGANPGCGLIRMDHLTDGDITELDIEPEAGDEIETDYSPGAAASLGLNPAEACFDCNLDGVPMWQEFVDIGDRFDVNTLVSSGDSQMSYGMFYVDVARDITVDVGVASDDSIQVLAAPVGEEMIELHCNSVARGGGGANSVQDVIPDVELSAGQWKFMVKVFEGGGGHNWRFRFQKNGAPIVPGEISLVPNSPGPTLAILKPGDVNGDGDFNISDPVAHLNFLFASSAIPACFVVPDSQPIELTSTGNAVLDFNGDGGSNIADAVGSLNRLFGGGGPHALGVDCVEIEGVCMDTCAQ